jgi:hypothetical protein
MRTIACRGSHLLTSSTLLPPGLCASSPWPPDRLPALRRPQRSHTSRPHRSRSVDLPLPAALGRRVFLPEAASAPLRLGPSLGFPRLQRPRGCLPETGMSFLLRPCPFLWDVQQASISSGSGSCPEPLRPGLLAATSCLLFFSQSGGASAFEAWLLTPLACYASSPVALHLALPPLARWGRAALPSLRHFPSCVGRFPAAE